MTEPKQKRIVLIKHSEQQKQETPMDIRKSISTAATREGLVEVVKKFAAKIAQDEGKNPIAVESEFWRNPAIYSAYESLPNAPVAKAEKRNEPQTPAELQLQQMAAKISKRDGVPHAIAYNRAVQQNPGLFSQCESQLEDVRKFGSMKTYTRNGDLVAIEIDTD
jgi:hypothetical protein